MHKSKGSTEASGPCVGREVAAIGVGWEGALAVVRLTGVVPVYGWVDAPPVVGIGINLAMLDHGVVKAAFIARGAKHDQIRPKSAEPNRP